MKCYLADDADFYLLLSSSHELLFLNVWRIWL